MPLSYCPQIGRLCNTESSMFRQRSSAGPRRRMHATWRASKLSRRGWTPSSQRRRRQSVPKTLQRSGGAGAGGWMSEQIASACVWPGRRLHRTCVHVLDSTPAAHLMSPSWLSKPCCNLRGSYPVHAAPLRKGTSRSCTANLALCESSNDCWPAPLQPIPIPNLQMLLTPA